MIKKLQWITKEGNKMTLSNTPITLGIDMMLCSCTKEEKIEIFKELKDELESK